MRRPDFLEQIKKRISTAELRTVFIPSDFFDIAESVKVNVVLSRLTEEKVLRRIIHGIYESPEYSEVSCGYAAPDPDKVARAIARKFGWTIVPCGDTALNMLGLSTRVPTVWSYVSDGPYKTYESDAVTLKFKRTTHKEISSISPKSALVIQALKALGQENLIEAIGKLKKLLSPEEKQRLLTETQYVTAWIYEAVKKICRENSGKI